jgi:hypothetical protein
LKSNGFLDNLSYESNERTNGWRTDGHKAVCKQLCKRSIEEGDRGAGRPFKLDIKSRFLMILVYYHLYITYTLADSI